MAGLFNMDLKGPLDAIGNIFDKLFTSDEEREQAKAVMEKLRMQPALVQAEINKVEAGHRSRLVAGWRPFLGWVGGIALFTFYIPKHVMAAYLWACQCFEMLRVATANNLLMDMVMPAYPISLDDTLMELLFGLLGLAGLRTAEKLKGRTK